MTLGTCRVLQHSQHFLAFTAFGGGCDGGVSVNRGSGVHHGVVIDGGDHVWV